VTGYLQRLAAGAAGSSGTIHPDLPPLYSNPLTDIGGAPPEFSVGASPAPGPRTDPNIGSEDAPGRWPESPVLVAPPRGNGRAAIPPALDEATPALRSPPDPAPSERWPPADTPSDAVRLVPATGGIFHRGERALGNPSRPADHPKHPRSESLFSPQLVGPAPIDSPAARLIGERLQPAPAARGGRQTGMAYASAHTAEPNDIAIHIGRIEVTAVQPAPPRAAPKPPRHAPSLDEYLKRRNGGRS
jgi:hypothetical protein